MSVKDNEAERGIVEEIRTKRSDYEEGVFGLLYTLSKGDSFGENKFLVVLNIWINFFQLCQFVFQASGWNFNSLGSIQGLWKIVAAFQIVQFQYFLSAGGFAFYCVLIIFLAIVAIVTVVLSLYVAYNFKTGFFPYVLPIQLVKMIVAVFITVFYITSLNVLLLILNCESDPKGGGGQVLAQLPSTACWDINHFPFAIIAICVSIFLVASALSINVGKFESNPLTTNLTGQANSASKIFVTFCETLLSVCQVFMVSTSIWWKLVQLFCFSLMCLSILRYLPFYHSWVSQLQTGCYAILIQAALCNLFLHIVDTAGVNATSVGTAITSLTFGLMPFSFFAGFTLCRWRSARFNGLNNSVREHDGRVTVSSRLRAAIHYEFASRFLSGQKTLEPELIELADSILHAGVWAHPRNAFIHIVYANFLLEVRKNSVMGDMYLSKARSFSPGLIDRFSIFVWDQDKKHKSQSAETGEDTNVVGFVAFNTAVHNAEHHVTRVIKLERAFFRAMADEDVVMQRVRTIIADIAFYRRHAANATDLLISRYGKSIQVLKLYGEYLDKVCADGENAASYLQAAVDLERQTQKQREEEKRSMFNLDEVDDDIDYVVASDHSGRIFHITSRLTKSLGYSSPQLLLGYTVNIVFPPQTRVKEQFLITGGEKYKLNQFDQTMLLQHSNGLSLPFRLWINSMAKDSRGRSGFLFRLALISAEEERTFHERDKPRFVLDSDWNVISFNKPMLAMLKLSEEELMTKSAAEILPELSAVHVSDVPDEDIQPIKVGDQLIPSRIIFTIAGADARRTVICLVAETFAEGTDNHFRRTHREEEDESEEADSEDQRAETDIDGKFDTKSLVMENITSNGRKRKLEILTKKLGRLVERARGQVLRRWSTIFMAVGISLFIATVISAMRSVDLASDALEMGHVGASIDNLANVCLFARAKRSGWASSSISYDFDSKLQSAVIAFDLSIRKLITTATEKDFRNTIVTIVDETGAGVPYQSEINAWTALQELRTSALIVSQMTSTELRSRLEGTYEWRYLMRNGPRSLDTALYNQLNRIYLRTSSHSSSIYALLSLSWIANVIFWILLTARALAPLSEWASRIRTDFIEILLTVPHSSYLEALNQKKSMMEIEDDGASESTSIAGESPQYNPNFDPLSPGLAAPRHGRENILFANGITPRRNEFVAVTPSEPPPPIIFSHLKIVGDVFGKFKKYIISTFVYLQIDAVRPSTGKAVTYTVQMGHMQLMLALSLVIVCLISAVFGLMISSTSSSLTSISYVASVYSSSSRTGELMFNTHEISGGWDLQTALAAQTKLASLALTETQSLIAQPTILSRLQDPSLVLPPTAIFSSGLQNGLVLWVGACSRLADIARTSNISFAWNANATTRASNAEVDAMLTEALITLIPNLYEIASSMGSDLGTPSQLRAVYISSIFLICLISFILWWSIGRVAAVDSLPEIQQLAFLLSAVPSGVSEICDRKIKKKRQMAGRELMLKERMHHRHIVPTAQNSGLKSN